MKLSAALRLLHSVALSWLVIDVGVCASLLVTWASTAAQVEAMRKEHERAEWIQQQQQQLLEAKYRKHLARERPLNAMERELEKKQAEDPSLAVRLFSRPPSPPPPLSEKRMPFKGVRRMGAPAPLTRGGRRCTSRTWAS